MVYKILSYKDGLFVAKMSIAFLHLVGKLTVCVKPYSCTKIRKKLNKQIGYVLGVRYYSYAGIIFSIMHRIIVPSLYWNFVRIFMEN